MERIKVHLREKTPDQDYEVSYWFMEEADDHKRFYTIFGTLQRITTELMDFINYTQYDV